MLFKIIQSRKWLNKFNIAFITLCFMLVLRYRGYMWL